MTRQTCNVCGRLVLKELTEHEKREELARWCSLRALPYDPEAPGTPDPAILPLTDRLNALSGLCTVQSCGGHTLRERKAEGRHLVPGHLWLRLSGVVLNRFQQRVDDLLRHPEIEEVSIRFGRSEGGPVLEIIFAGRERDRLAASQEIIYEFFASCVQTGQGADTA